MLNRIKKAINAVRINLHERKEKRLFQKWDRIKKREHYEQMIELAEQLQKRAPEQKTIANAPKVQIKKAA